MSVDVDALGAFILSGQGLIWLIQATQEAGFACSALAEDQHFGFIQVIYFTCVAFTKIAEDGVIALGDDFEWGDGERAILHHDAAPTFTFNFDSTFDHGTQGREIAHLGRAQIKVLQRTQTG